MRCRFGCAAPSRSRWRSSSFCKTRTNGGTRGDARRHRRRRPCLLLVERLIETPREAVERTLYELADTVEANDVPARSRYLAPTRRTRKIRKDVETLMPLVKIERANIIGTPKIEVDDGDDRTRPP